MLEQAHPNSIAVFAVNEKLVNELALDHKPKLAVDVDRFFIFAVDDEVQLIEVEYGKAVVHCQLSGAGRKTSPLIVRGDNDLKLGASVDVVNLNQLDQTGFFPSHSITNRRSL